jgi:hypothetical protein
MQPLESGPILCSNPVGFSREVRALWTDLDSSYLVGGRGATGNLHPDAVVRPDRN